ncbi:MAG: MerR family transcriptional regulator [Paracoccaceae bacterium]
MEKSPNAFRTISEVSDTLDVPAHVLRFWESKFPQVKPVKRGGGRRYYRPEDVALLVGVRELLYEDGLTIKGVQKIFRERGARSVIERGAEAMESLGVAADGAAGPARAAPEAVAPPQPSRAPAAPVPDEAPAEPEAAAGADAEPAVEVADPARVRAAIARLEALRERLRRDPLDASGGA